MHRFLSHIFRVVTAPVRHWRISLTILIALAIAYIITDQVLLSKLAAQREAIIAAGGRLTLREFARDIPDSENAAVVYKYAASVLQEPAPPSRDRDPVTEYIRSKTCRGPAETEDAGEADAPITPEEQDWVERYIAANGRTCDAILEAAAKPHAQYTDYNATGDVTLDPAFAVPKLPTFASLRALARLAALQAVWQHAHGNQAEAYRWVGTTLAIGNSLSEEPWLMAGLIRASIHDLALASLRAMVCEQPLPEQLPEVLTAQLAQAAVTTTLGRFYEGERWLSNAMDIRTMRIRPLATANQLASLKMTTGLIEAVSLPDEARRLKLLRQFQQEMPPVEVKKGLPPIMRMHHILADIVRPALSNSIRALDRSAANARGAQAVVALKQYKKAHGEYPEQLAQIAPEFMGAVPIDPFSAEPLRYIRQENGFVVYSIGPDYEDSGGKEFNGKTGDIVWTVAD